MSENEDARPRESGSSNDHDDFLDGIDLDKELEFLVETDKVRAKPGAIAVIVTPVRTPQDLAAIMSIRGLDAQVAGSQSGALVWLKLTSSHTDEFDALLGDDRPIPDEADTLARKLSEVIPYGVVVVMSWLEEGDVEPGVTGQMTARRYVDGEMEDPIPAGLLLSSLDERVENLLLGRITPEELDDGDQAHSMSTFEAIKHLGRLFRRGGK